eukprot:3458339-Rhodomonas_salina.1
MKPPPPPPCFSVSSRISNPPPPPPPPPPTGEPNAAPCETKWRVAVGLGIRSRSCCCSRDTLSQYRCCARDPTTIRYLGTARAHVTRPPYAISVRGARHQVQELLLLA